MALGPCVRVVPVSTEDAKIFAKYCMFVVAGERDQDAKAFYRKEGALFFQVSDPISTLKMLYENEIASNFPSECLESCSFAKRIGVEVATFVVFA